MGAIDPGIGRVQWTLENRLAARGIATVPLGSSGQFRETLFGNLARSGALKPSVAVLGHVQEPFLADLKQRVNRVVTAGCWHPDLAPGVVDDEGQAATLRLPERLPDLPKEPRQPEEVSKAASRQRLDVRLAQAGFDTAAAAQGLTTITSFTDIELGIRRDTRFDGASRSNPRGYRPWPTRSTSISAGRRRRNRSWTSRSSSPSSRSLSPARSCARRSSCRNSPRKSARRASNFTGALR